MTDDKKISIPSSPLRTARSSVLTTFEPGASTLEATYQGAPPFESLPPTSSSRRMSRSRCETGP
jgi:hypothetical protein